MDTLHADAAGVLSGMIENTAGARRFYVFNPLGWTRTDAADLIFEEVGPYR